MAYGMASCPMNESVVFGELWENRTKFCLVQFGNISNLHLVQKTT